ncbi:MAG: cytochrome c biogenesis protein CcdA [Candidatus Omnitrophota bacterium]|nr:cytochrome c biogenesis protein CcdA [Candidatus Omnitrophota bacterium]
MNLSGTGLDFLIAFGGGVLISFTPCVYPLIPVTAGLIGVSAEGRRLKGFLLSLFYVAGIALVYSILGLFAALTGQIFGRISTSPAAYFIAGTLIIIFAFSMMDLFTLPFWNAPRLAVSGRRGYIAAFLLGTGTGLVISPCLSPVLGSILAYLATKRNLLYGTFLLFSFAWGMGLLLIIVGIFSSAILRWLPKSGKWMIVLKRFYAFVMLAAGLYFIYQGIRRF